MLWPDLPTALVKRAGVGGIDAYCKDPFSFLSKAVLIDALLIFKANKLITVKKCLNEVLKYGGPFNARDLYPVSQIPFISTWVRLTTHFLFITSIN
jgi:hypothetical protein